MDFSKANSSQKDEGNPSPEPQVQPRESILADVFSKLGVEIQDEAEKEKQDDDKEKEKDKEEEVSNFLSSVPLPSFNTKDHKMKRILESVPDFDWLFVNTN